MQICKGLALTLCVLLLLGCLFSTLLSHDHQCRDDDCIVCTLIDLLKSVFVATIVCVAAVVALRDEMMIPAEKQLVIKNETPVMKKVKLTN